MVGGGIEPPTLCVPVRDSEEVYRLAGRGSPERIL